MWRLIARSPTRSWLNVAVIAVAAFVCSAGSWRIASDRWRWIWIVGVLSLAYVVTLALDAWRRRRDGGKPGGS